MHSLQRLHLRCSIAVSIGSDTKGLGNRLFVEAELKEAVLGKCYSFSQS